MENPGEGTQPTPMEVPDPRGLLLQQEPVDVVGAEGGERTAQP